MEEDPIQRLYREAYEGEHKRREQLNSRVSVPVAALTVLIGAAVYIVDGLPLQSVGLLAGLCLALIVASLVVIASSFYHLARCVFVDRYDHLPGLHRIHAYIQQLERYNAQAAAGQAKDIAATVAADLRQGYLDAAEKNIARNNRKARHLVKSIKGLVIAAALLGVAALPFFVIKTGMPAPLVRVQLLQPEEGSNMSGDSEQQQPEPAEPEQPQPEVELPTFPPNEVRHDYELDDEPPQAEQEREAERG